ncbi:MAG TPA: hypothetical protein VGE90_05715 [Chitinophaga sp.]
MAEQQAEHMIHTLRRRWRVNALLVHIMTALGLTSVATVLVCKVHDSSLWCAIPVGITSLLLLLLPSRAWRIDDADVVRYFNTHYPELEDSCALLLKPPHTLGMLEQLQVGKIEQVLQRIPPPHPYKKQLRVAVLFLTGALLISAALYIWWHPISLHEQKTNERPRPTGNLPPAMHGIAAVEITITPPSYTAKQQRQQQQLDLEVEEGARIQWEIRTNKQVPSLQLVLNDTGQLNLEAQNNEGTLWRGSMSASHSGFYQVKLADKLSGLYKLALIKDLPPVITVQAPASYTVIDYGMPQTLTMQVSLTDDYGIRAAGIQATVASGSGEAVKFKEQALSLDAVFNGTRKQYSLQRTINLGSLGMQPGTELYLYIQAEDNHQQYSRSGMYMVVLPDTAQLMSLEGLANSVNVKPEYFRSQRQIIIETEQLIRDKDTLSEKTFRQRSNDLGIDQRLLRLRYGRFLGEETETNLGEERVSEEEHDGHAHDHAKEDDAVNAKDFNNAEKIIEQFSHKHDIAEDASFFDPVTKQQLKATLAEMWNAELRLRTFKPQEALPYEYKALRLLKDLQQKSRAYVGKTSVKTAPLKPEKRLTGELDKIIVPILQRDHTQTASIERLPQALAILERLKSGTPVSDPVTINILREAARQMSTQATASPARYLSSLQAMRRVLDALEQRIAINPVTVTEAAQAVYDMVPEPARLPQAVRIAAGAGLSQQYFKNLNRQQ